MFRGSVPFKIYYPFEFSSKVILKIADQTTGVVQNIQEETEEKTFGIYKIWTSVDAASCQIGMNFKLKPGIYPANLYEEYQLTADRLLQSVGREVHIERPGNTNTILSSVKEN